MLIVNNMLFLGVSVQQYLVSVVRPRRPLHVAALDVEGEVLHINVAGAAVDAVTEPHHFAVAAHYHVRVDHRRTVLGIRTETYTMCSTTFTIFFSFKIFV